MKNPVIARYGIHIAWTNIAAVLLSGLIFPVITMIFYKQPAWEGPEVFIAHYHPFQTTTFFSGFLLVISSLLIFIVLYKNSDTANKIAGLSALMINAVFTPIIILNYILQITYVPYLAVHQPAGTADLLTAFTMSNPGSVAWALEMYGWGGIGLSYLVAALIFRNTGGERILKALFVTNGVCSIASAGMTSADMNWIFSKAGLVALVVWNLLIILIDIFLIRYFRNMVHRNYAYQLG
jgi:hypothetical protein